MQVHILAYSGASESTKQLQTKLQGIPTQYGDVASVKRYRPDAPYVRRLQQAGYPTYDEKTVLVRWGNSPAPLANLPANRSNLLTLNFTDLKPYINKKEFFNTFKDFNDLPEFYTDRVAAQEMLDQHEPSTSPVLVERQILDGHSGAGIRLLAPGDTAGGDGKLWVRYIKKQREFRCHFLKLGDTGEAKTYYAEKLLKKTATAEPVPNRFQVRNWQNGWVYATTLVEPVPTVVQNVAKSFIAQSNMKLDFGAIDLIYNKKNDSAYVLEVNTAPGIVGKTAQFYRDVVLDAIYQHNWNSTNTKFTVSSSFIEPVLDDLEDDYEDPEEYSSEPDDNL